MKKFRKIEKAVSGHGYQVTEFDADMRQVNTKVVGIDKTRVRLRDARSKWEEMVDGCPGWWSCEAPKAA